MHQKLGANASVLRAGLGAFVALELIGSKHGGNPVGRPIFDERSLFSPNGSDVVGPSRMERFGETLFNLQSTDGFADWIADYAVSELEPRFAEIDAARLMYRGGVLRRLRGRVGRAGEDYDCDLVVQGTEIACDIKAKVESTSMSVRAFQSSIETAYDQLPTAKPSIVWVKLPRSWAEVPEPMLLTLEVAMSEIREWSGHIIAVACHWEELVGALVVQLKYRLFTCASDVGSQNVVNELDERLFRGSGEPWTSFPQLVDECVAES